MLQSYTLKGRDHSGQAGWNLVVEDCWKCSGTGQFAHYGVCFCCGGARRVGSYQPTDDHAATLAERRERRHARRLARERAERAERAAAEPWVMGCALALAALGDDHGIAGDVFATVLRRGMAPTEGQARVLLRAGLKVQALAEAPAPTPEPEPEPVPEGRRLLVEGEIVSAQWRDSAYGTQCKLLVKLPAGGKLWGTCPASVLRTLADDDLSPLRGRQISMTANVERSRDDECFGFWSRPTKAKISPAK